MLIKMESPSGGGGGGTIPVYVLTGVGSASDTKFKCITLDGTNSEEGTAVSVTGGSQTLLNNDDVTITVTSSQFQIYNKVPIRICQKSSRQSGWFSYTEVNSSTTTTYNYESDIVVQRQS